MSARIGIFSGTFDPVHKGHISIARAFLASGKIDKLWVLPTPDPPHKSDQPVTSFCIRLDLVKLAFKDFDDVFVSDFENSLERPSYTLKTIYALKKQYTDDEFLLCIGSDSLEQITTWYHYKELINECFILVATRPGFNRDKVDKFILSKCIFIDHEPVDISSTEIKKGFSEGKRHFPELPSAILDKIIELGLYH